LWSGEGEIAVLIVSAAMQLQQSLLGRFNLAICTAFWCNGVAAESNPAGKDLISEGFRTVDDNIPGCHKGQTELLASMDIDGSKQCSPAMAGNPSRVEALTARNLRPVKDQKGTDSVPKKMENCEGRHRQPTVKKRLSSVRENVLTTLREFRVIYKKLLEEEEAKLRERGHGLRHRIR
jgi:hypothetical protein